jgi:peptidoglycan/LPS O-acetylase OafA/YrhL
MGTGMSDFVWGLITMGYAVAGLFFLRFWTRTRDGLFAAFAAAFWLLALNQALVALSDVPREEQTWFYLLRLAAFMLIIGAVIAKNWRRGAR